MATIDDYPITNNVPQTTIEKALQGDDLKVTLKCNSGYVFDGIPTVNYNDYNGDFHYQEPFTVDETQTSATAVLVYPDPDPSYSEIEVNGSTKQGGGSISINVSNEIAGTTEAHNFDGSTATITVTGNKPRYRFFNAKAKYTGTDGEIKTVTMNVTVQEYGSTATVEISNLNPNEVITLTGKYEDVCYVTNNLENCTAVDGLPEYYRIGANLDITLNANSGTEFDPEKPPQLFYETNNGDPAQKDFTVSPDKATANLLFNMSDPTNEVTEGSDLEFAGGAVPKQVIGGNYGAINVYIVTLDNLAEFAQKRFFREASDPDTGQSFEYIDLGKYVNRIKRIHCTVPSSSTDVLKCGNYNTNISVLAPAVETINLDFGSVVIPAHNSDNTDYESEVQIFLPFKGFVTVPADYVGKSVNLEYVVNIVTGYGVAKLSYNGAVFQVEEVNPATDVLYRTADVDLTLIGSDSWDESLLYGLTPYVYIKWYESRNKNERNADNVTGKIGDFRGFIKLDNITTISTPDMLIMEQEMIYSELENGVYIE